MFKTNCELIKYQVITKQIPKIKLILTKNYGFLAGLLLMTIIN